MGKTIWVVAQVRDGGLHPMSREAVAAGQQLAAATEGEVSAVVLGDGPTAAVEALGSLALASIKVVSDSQLGTYTPGAFVGTLAALLGEHSPDVVLFPHTYQSVDFVPRLAQQLGAALVTDVTAVRAEGEELRWTRPVFAGKLVSEVRVRDGRMILATLQSGAYSSDDLQSGSAAVEELSPTVAAADREILGVDEAASEHVDLGQAEVIVAVGRGIGEADKLAVVQELAGALKAELGASRPVIDSGWVERDRQIGSSGQTVAPKLYVAVGISGAIQHLVGMKGSRTVVAINKDVSAPIFGVADYGIVGDLFEVVPALTAAIRAAKQE